MRGRLVCRAVRYGYRIVDVLEYSGYDNIFCRHFKRGKVACFAVEHNAVLTRPADKTLARRHFCDNVDTIAVFCRYALGRVAVRICRASLNGCRIVDILISRFCGNIGCAYRESQLCLRKV